MLRLSMLSGKTAGTAWVARRFPVRIGRAARCDLRLEESGVWDEHVQILFVPDEGFVAETIPNASATVNGQSIGRTILRNGDEIEIGSVRMQFCLSETRQTGLRLREAATWAAIAAISLGQIALIYWLLI